jgi:hypothetical protein
MMALSLVLSILGISALVVGNPVPPASPKERDVQLSEREPNCTTFLTKSVPTAAANITRYAVTKTVKFEVDCKGCVLSVVTNTATNTVTSKLATTSGDVTNTTTWVTSELASTPSVVTATGTASVTETICAKETGTTLVDDCALVLCPYKNVCKMVRGKPTCTPMPGESQSCGGAVCAAGYFCCNRSCGMCAPRGGACTQQYCGNEGLELGAMT